MQHENDRGRHNVSVTTHDGYGRCEKYDIFIVNVCLLCVFLWVVRHLNNREYPKNIDCLSVIVLLFISLSLLLGASLLLFSFLPYQSVKNILDAISLDGKVDGFSLDGFNPIAVRLRYIGVAVCSATLFVLFFRDALKTRLKQLAASFSPFLRDTRAFFRNLQNEDITHKFALVSIIAISVYPRFHYLSMPARCDESLTYLSYASRPLLYGLSSYTAPNNHLFHTFLVHFAYLAFGNHMWAFRLPAFTAGVLLVVSTYVFVRVHFNKRAGLLSAALTASSSILIEYSTNARGYTIVCLLFTLLLGVSAYIKKNNNPVAWAILIILSTIGFYTIPIMLYPYGIFIAWLILSAFMRDAAVGPKTMLKQTSMASLIVVLTTAILYLPPILKNGIAPIIENPYVVTLDNMYFGKNILQNFIATFALWNRDMPQPVKICMAIGFFASLVFHRRASANKIPLSVSTILWLAPVIILQRVVPFERIWLFLLPLYFGMSSHGVILLMEPLFRARPRRFDAAIVVISLALSLWISASVVTNNSIYYSKEGWTLLDAERISTDLKEYLRPGDGIIISVQGELPLMYYFDLHDNLNSYLKYLVRDFNKADRLIVIVNTLYDENIRGLLRQFNISAFSYGDAVLVKKYNTSIIYEIRRDGAHDYR